MVRVDQIVDFGESDLVELFHAACSVEVDHHAPEVEYDIFDSLQHGGLFRNVVMVYRQLSGRMYRAGPGFEFQWCFSLKLMTDFFRLQELFGSGLVLTHRCPAVVVYPSDVPVTSFVCSVCFRLFVRWQLFRMCCRGFYRRNSGLGFGDRGCGLGGLRRCCRRSGRFGICRFLRSSGLRELYRRLFRCSRNEDFRRRGSRCIRCFRIGRPLSSKCFLTISFKANRP